MTATPGPTAPTGADDGDDQRRAIATHASGGDRLFRGVAAGSGVLTLAIVGAVAVLLAAQGWPAIHRAGFAHFLTSETFGPDVGGAIGALLYGTVVVAVIAMVLAIPVALAAALFINLYAPPRLRTLLVLVIDLLAAIPSLIFGLWGFYYLQPHMVGTTRWLNDHASWIPIFRNSTGIAGGSLFLAGIVVAVMVMPIMTSIIRDVLARVPSSLVEAAYALGGTRSSMVRDVMLPYGRNGILGATMLGLGRALGETVAVATVLAPSIAVSVELTRPGGNTISSAIALFFNNAKASGKQTLVAAGLTLFAVTLVVNMVARTVVNRSVLAGAVDG